MESRSDSPQVFFGTPHRGSNMADWVRCLGAIAKVVDRRDLIKALEKNNKALLEISQDFVSIVGSRNYAIKSFYEEHKIKGVTLVRASTGSSIIQSLIWIPRSLTRTLRR
jgi:dihydroorotase